LLSTEARESARSLLLESLPWSPLDFIRGVSPGGDRAVHVASLLRDIDPGNDLRFRCTLGANTDVAVCAERLPWDSSFFGYGVARLHGVFPLRKGGYAHDADYAPAIDALHGLARDRGIRYLFAVIDARDQPTTRALTAAGFALIETRLYFHQPLEAYRYPRRFRCRLATPDDIEALTALARSVENPYDRFNADPFIAKADALRMIDTWIRASIVERFADATLIPDSRSPGAVCTVKYHADKAATWGTSVAQMMLALSARGKGTALVGLISETNYHLQERGVDHVFFTTQVGNRAAIRVAEHLGFKVGRGEYVFRLLL
jgi:RimJ/RimL family protein N-acetyltransferase